MPKRYYLYTVHARKNALIARIWHQLIYYHLITALGDCERLCPARRYLHIRSAEDMTAKRGNLRASNLLLDDRQLLGGVEGETRALGHFLQNIQNHKRIRENCIVKIKSQGNYGNLRLFTSVEMDRFGGADDEK